MSDTRIVKVENLLQSQIPSFLNNDSPLFKEFLKQYYISQSHETGISDIINNLEKYKNIQSYASEKNYTSLSKNTCYLIENITSYDDVITVNSTTGFPSKYGLLKIDDEIITYKGKTDTTFTGCVRGFGGISEITEDSDYGGLIFLDTLAEQHSSKSVVNNLNLVFYSKLFEKFKFHYLPDFEKRELNPNINLDLILSRARDFYLTKGSDVSFKILFEILYDNQITIFKPKENIIRTSLGKSLNTKNILVEIISGEIDPLELKGYTITQDLGGGIFASASIYNVEFRPVDNLNLYEISLDPDSFVNDFSITQKTTVLEQVSDGIFVDSTIGFQDSGTLFVKIKSDDLTTRIETINYTGKTINKFLNTDEIDFILPNDELIEDKLLKVVVDEDNEIEFRLINVLKDFDFSFTNGLRVNDIITLSSFGENYDNTPEFTSWIYNYPTYHKVKSISGATITFYSDLKFIIGDELQLIDENDLLIKVTKVSEINSDRQITLNTSELENVFKVKKIIKKSILSSPERNEETSTDSCYIQNTYYDKINNSVIVASSGLPSYTNNPNILNKYTFTLKGKESSFSTYIDDNLVNHNMITGYKVYLTVNESIVDDNIKSGEYFVKELNNKTLSLYKTNSDLFLSFSNVDNKGISLNSSTEIELGTIVLLKYKDITDNFTNQLLLKEFKIKETYNKNKVDLLSQIYNIEEAWNVYKT